MQTRDPPWNGYTVYLAMEPEGSFYYVKKRW